jgi:hypothetical protein
MKEPFAFAGLLVVEDVVNRGLAHPSPSENPEFKSIW